jgi:hypothetical protein
VASKAQNHVFVLLERMLAIDEQQFCENYTNCLQMMMSFNCCKDPVDGVEFLFLAFGSSELPCKSLKDLRNPTM